MILPALTFCATANVVVHLGAKPVLVDVDDSLLMDMNDADQKLSCPGSMK